VRGYVDGVLVAEDEAAQARRILVDAGIADELSKP
jgi:hypothetical protein